MPYYPYPNGTGDFLGLMTYNNTVTNDAFGLALVIIIFMVMFLAFKGFRTEQALTSASFITAISTYLLSVLGLVSTWVILIPTVMVVGSLFLLMRN